MFLDTLHNFNLSISLALYLSVTLLTIISRKLAKRRRGLGVIIWRCALVTQWPNYFLFMDVWRNCLLCPGFKTIDMLAIIYVTEETLGRIEVSWVLCCIQERLVFRLDCPHNVQIFGCNCNWINVVQMPTLNHCTHVIILIEHYHKSIQILYIIRIALCLCTLIHSHLLQLFNNIATRYLKVAPLTQRRHLHWAHEFCNWVSWWRLPFPKFEDPKNIG